MGKLFKQSKPKSASWRLPICGGRACWVIVGRKHVRICEAFSNIKMKIRRAEWDALGKREIA
jgi:hypothetical protein